MKKIFWAMLLTFGIALVTAGCNANANKADNVNDQESAVQGENQTEQEEQGGESVFNAAKPFLFANLGDKYYTPDGMTIADDTGILYLNVPNFGNMEGDKKIKKDSEQGGYLLQVNKDGTFKELLVYPVSEVTGQCGPMGLDMGPDGNLYVCDNQFFHNTDYASRILRVVMKDGQPTGEVQVVIEGVHLANGMVWVGDKLFYTDSVLDTETDDTCIGMGGVFMFTMDELKDAGNGDNPPIKVNAKADDSHCVVAEKVVKLGRGDNTGADGITADSNGVIWFGNFGNGFVYAIYPDADGNYKSENAVNVFDALNQTPFTAGPFKPASLQCCDGMFYDAGTNKVFIDDSQNNAIWAFTPVAQGEKIKPEVIWRSDDTDGMDGSLDQPCEAIVMDGKLIMACFDWPFPGLDNSTFDPPGTLSAIDYEAVKKVIEYYNKQNQ